MSKLKVLHLGSPSGLYGAERWILALAKNFDKTKADVHIGVVKDHQYHDANLCAEAGKLGIKSHVFEAYGKINLKAVKLLRNFIINEKINIVHTHFYKTDIVAWLACMGMSCKTVATPHGWTENADKKQALYEKLDRFVYNFLDAVVPLSKKMYDDLKGFPLLRSKLHLILNGVDLDEVRKCTGIDRQILELKREGYYLIGYIGRLVPEKGLDRLLNCVKYLNRKWKIVLVGEGNQLEDIKEQSSKLGIEKNIIYLGYRHDRISILNGFDIFAMPSRSEGIPRVLMEAMAAKVPIVASDIPGCRALIKDKVTGFIINYNSPEEFVRVFDIIAENVSIRNRIKTEAEIYVNENFSAKRMADQYLNLYCSMTSTEFLR